MTGLFNLILLDANQHLLFSEGKSWTVIGVMLIIFLGIIAFLIFQERKIASLEERVNDITGESNKNSD